MKSENRQRPAWPDTTIGLMDPEFGNHSEREILRVLGHPKGG